MPRATRIGRLVALGTLVATASFVCAPAISQAKSHSDTTHHRNSPATLAAQRGHSGRTLAQYVSTHRNAKYAFAKGSKARFARHGYYYAGLQCVPFARAASGIELKGNAANWWDAAAGVYERGARPEPGSVLNFRANGHMRLGHVAVVTAVLGAREIAIEHAHWAGPGANKGGVARNIPVEDVSPGNDWSEVRVGLGHSGEYGSVYPTYGFIYDRPDSGTMMANTPDSDSREAQNASFTEVAQAPGGRVSGMIRPKLLLDAPSRNLQ